MEETAMKKRSENEEPKIYLYKGGLSIVGKSGVGSAIRHQEQMLSETRMPVAERWKEAAIVHINTVFPDSLLASWLAKRQGKKVVYYGHSTMEDFRDSFVGSNKATRLFKKWICVCYETGDVVLTPTEYSMGLLAGYGIRKPIYPLTNGVDTDFFQADKEAGKRFRDRFQIPEGKKVVISAGHFMRRKGIFDFLHTAAGMPEILFFWFGGGNRWAVPRDVKHAIRNRPANVRFPGYISQQELKEAYCGADAFAFFSYEETEGIVVLEALSCEVPVVVRDIPVYAGWLQDGIHVYKALHDEDFRQRLNQIFSGSNSEMTEAGRRLAQERGLCQTGKRLREIYRAAGICPR